MRRATTSAEMARNQLRRRGIADEAVIAAMEAVRREEFVPAHLVDAAYEDGPLGIGGGQTISQPYIVARMLEAARLRPGERVLDVGTGSGYAAAVAETMGAVVVSVERDAALGEAARERLQRLGYGTRVLIGDGSLGLPEAAPFDAILVAASSPEVPDALRRQLAPGGRLVIPVGTAADGQELLRIVRDGADGFTQETLALVRFVPLVGEGGWRDTHAARGFEGPREDDGP